MDRRSFIDAISAKTGISKEDTGLLLDALRDTIAERCSESDSVALPGFGAFEAKKRLERVAVHPASGKRLLIPPKISLVFKPSAILKQKVNQPTTITDQSSARYEQ